MDQKKIARRGLVWLGVITGIVLFVVVVGAVGSSAEKHLAHLASWDWKEVAVLCAAIIGFAIIAK